MEAQCNALVQGIEDLVNDDHPELQLSPARTRDVKALGNGLLHFITDPNETAGDKLSRFKFALKSLASGYREAEAERDRAVRRRALDKAGADWRAEHLKAKADQLAKQFFYKLMAAAEAARLKRASDIAAADKRAKQMRALDKAGADWRAKHLKAKADQLAKQFFYKLMGLMAAAEAERLNRALDKARVVQLAKPYLSNIIAEAERFWRARNEAAAIAQRRKKNLDDLDALPLHPRHGKGRSVSPLIRTGDYMENPTNKRHRRNSESGIESLLHRGLTFDRPRRLSTIDETSLVPAPKDPKTPESSPRPTESPEESPEESSESEPDGLELSRRARADAARQGVADLEASVTAYSARQQQVANRSIKARNTAALDRTVDEENQPEKQRTPRKRQVKELDTNLLAIAAEEGFGFQRVVNAVAARPEMAAWIEKEKEASPPRDVLAFIKSIFSVARWIECRDSIRGSSIGPPQYRVSTLRGTNLAEDIKNQFKKMEDDERTIGDIGNRVLLDLYDLSVMIETFHITVLEDGGSVVDEDQNKKPVTEARKNVISATYQANSMSDRIAQYLAEYCFGHTIANRQAMASTSGKRKDNRRTMQKYRNEVRKAVVLNDIVKACRGIGIIFLLPRKNSANMLLKSSKIFPDVGALARFFHYLCNALPVLPQIFDKVKSSIMDVDPSGCNLPFVGMSDDNIANSSIVELIALKSQLLPTRPNLATREWGDSDKERFDA